MPPRAAPFVLLSAALALALALGACAGAGAPAVATRDPCSADEAFERGLADGEAGRAEDLAWAGACTGAPEADVAAAYRHGHAAGVASRASDAADAPGAAGEGAWRCEVQARGDPFHGDGATREAAVAAARDRCRERNGERYCRDVSCRRVE